MIVVLTVIIALLLLVTSVQAAGIVIVVKWSADERQLLQNDIRQLTESLARSDGKVFVNPTRKEDTIPSRGWFDAQPLPAWAAKAERKAKT